MHRLKANMADACSLSPMLQSAMSALVTQIVRIMLRYSAATLSSRRLHFFHAMQGDILQSAGTSLHERSHVTWMPTLSYH